MRRTILGATALAGCALQDDANQGGDPPQLIIESAEGGDDEDQDPTAPTFPSSATKNTVRVAGENPAADAGGVASAVFPATSEATRPNAVALVDGDDWQSAVAASVLTFGKVGAPLLLSDGDELPPVTAAALSRLDPSGSEVRRERTGDPHRRRGGPATGRRSSFRRRPTSSPEPRNASAKQIPNVFRSSGPMFNSGCTGARGYSEGEASAARRSTRANRAERATLDIALHGLVAGPPPR